MSTIRIDGSRLTVEDVVAIAHGLVPVALDQSESFRHGINRGSDFLQRLLQEDGDIYGVTTGYGDSCVVQIPPDRVAELPHNLVAFHGCGLGAIFGERETRAIMVARLLSLARGYSGVRYDLLSQLFKLVDKNVLPLIPQEGSVGASGDLTPLSYVVAVMCGQREVLYEGEVRPASEVLAELGMAPLTLQPKEGLAMMNGTAVMTGCACLAFHRARYLARLAARISALVVMAAAGNPYHFDEGLFAVKPHVGQQKVAAWIRSQLPQQPAPRNSQRLQDRYSLRCAPHVIGVQVDAEPWLQQIIENELNSSNDNPIIDAEHERVLHGGHFYGGHIAVAMDTLKNTVANIADLLDRQIAHLVDPKYNNGLPPNLTGVDGDDARTHHGLKAVQIASSAWTAEALKQTMPASVFSRSTECHNQDKVSMGTIAARDCLRVLELTEQVASAALLAAAQALELRSTCDGVAVDDFPAGLRETLSQVRETSAPLKQDRRLDGDLRALVQRIINQDFAVDDSARERC